MALTKIQPNIIAVANNVTNKTVGNTTSIPSFTFDGAGVVTSASNVAISGAGITANTVANSAFQTGSVENYMSSQGTSFGIRNKIINGAMMIDQRNAGANLTPTLSNQFSCDRWKTSISPGGVFSMQQDSSANTVAGFTSSLKMTSLTATTLSATQFELFGQPIEGYAIADLAWGTANAKAVTLSFWVRSSLTGTFGGALLNDDQNYNYAFSYTIVAANTWEYKTITIAGPTGGTWKTDNNTGIKLFWALGCGSTYSVTPGSWGTATALSATGAVNLTGTAGATFYITGVQLEKGSQATPFEYRQYTTELQLCQRYLVSYKADSSYAKFALGMTTTTAQGTCIQHFPVSMRTVPSLTVSSTASQYGIYYVAGGDGTCSSVPTLNPNSSTLVGTSAWYLGSGLTTGQAILMQSNNNTSAYVNWSAEL